VVPGGSRLPIRGTADAASTPGHDRHLVDARKCARAVLAGWFDLRIHGQPVRLEAHRLLEPGVDEQSLSIFFRDATTAARPTRWGVTSILSGSRMDGG